MLRLGNEIHVEQGSPEWFKLRAGKITASMFKVVMGGSESAKIRYGEQLNREYFGGLDQPFSSEATAWGHEQEAAARESFAFHIPGGQDARRAGFFIHPLWNYVGASVDVVCEAADAIGEVKAPYNPKRHLQYIEQGFPQEHHWQVQGGLFVTDARVCYFASFDPRALPSLRFHYRAVLPDPVSQNRLHVEIPRFWHKYVLGEHVGPAEIPKLF